MSLFEYNKELHEKTMIEIGREEGLAEGHSIGLKEGLIKANTRIIISKVKKGCSLPQIADALEESVETIAPLYEAVLRHAPDYNMDLILDDILKITRN